MKLPPIAHLPRIPPDLLRGLKICLLAGTLGQGGAERQLFYILKCLQEHGAEVNLLSLSQDEFWEAPMRRLGVPIHFVGESGSRIVRVVRLTKVIRQLRPSLVQCQHFYSGIYGGFAGRFLGIPSIGAVRSDGLWELKANGRAWFTLCLLLPNWIVANSKQSIKNLGSLGFSPKRILLLPNVIDSERYRPGIQPVSKKEFVVLGIGSFEPAKRFDRFFRIAAELPNRINRELRVVLAGDGRHRSEIETLAAQARQNGVTVEMTGRVGDPLPLYQQADVLLLTSDREGTPNVIMEAMSCGLPVVATNVGGVGGLVRSGETGFLFDRGDCQTAVNALVRLADEAALAGDLGYRAREFIQKYHELGLLPKFLSELYGRILSFVPQHLASS